MIRLLIAEDFPLFRDGLRARISEERDIKVIGEVSTGDDVIPALSEKDIDVLILDISLPGKDGLQLLPEIKRRFPHVAVLFLTLHPPETFAVRSMRMGAAGYLTKEKAHREVIKAIRVVHRGGAYVDAGLAEELLEEVRGKGNPLPHESLSDREFEVFRLLAQGKAPKQIAAQLKLGLPTVYTYRVRVLRKMGLTTDPELVRYAINNKLL